MASERTLVLVKPDGVQRGLVGEVVRRLERRGLRLAGLKLMWVDEALAGRHYAEHAGKPFYADLVRFITSGPLVAMVWEGPGAVGLVRAAMGATDPASAAPGTIRGDLAVSVQNNLVHGSDSPERGLAEVGLFFRPEELVEWESALRGWVQGGG
jgi:nucleoside-diphosphate kinase